MKDLTVWNVLSSRPTLSANGIHEVARLRVGIRLALDEKEPESSNHATSI